MRNWLDNWSAKETDQNHMDAPNINDTFAMRINFFENYRQIDLLKNLKELNEFTEGSFIYTTPLLVGYTRMIV